VVLKRINEMNNLRRAIRADQNLLAKVQIEYDNLDSDSDYVVNRSPFTRWLFKTVFGYSDRIELKTKIAILSEKISIHH